MITILRLAILIYGRSIVSVKLAESTGQESASRVSSKLSLEIGYGDVGAVDAGDGAEGRSHDQVRTGFADRLPARHPERAFAQRIAR